MCLKIIVSNQRQWKVKDSNGLEAVPLGQHLNMENLCGGRRQELGKSSLTQRCSAFLGSLLVLGPVLRGDGIIWDLFLPFSLWLIKTGSSWLKSGPSVHQKQSRRLGRGVCRAAILPFFPRSPCPRVLIVHNAKNWLQQVLFVAVPSVGSPHTRCPAWLPPHRAFSHSYPPGASLLLFVTSLGKMSHGHFACPQRGDSATLAAATPAPLLRCLAYQQAPSCEELDFASLHPLDAASCRGVAPCSPPARKPGRRSAQGAAASSFAPFLQGGCAWSCNTGAQVSCTCLRALLLPQRLINADNVSLGLLLRRRRFGCSRDAELPAQPCSGWRFPAGFGARAW